MAKRAPKSYDVFWQTIWFLSAAYCKGSSILLKVSSLWGLTFLTFSFIKVNIRDLRRDKKVFFCRDWIRHYIDLEFSV